MKRFCLGKRKTTIFLSACACMLFFGIAWAVISHAGARTSETILNNIYIGGVDVGGMTREQAMEACRSQEESLGEITISFVCGEENVETTLAQMGYTSDLAQVVDEAAGYGHKGNVLKRYRESHDIEQGEAVVLDLNPVLDEGTAVSVMEQLLAPFNQSSAPATFSIEQGKPVIEPEKNGIRVNLDETLLALKTKLAERQEEDRLQVEVVREEETSEINSELLGQVDDVLGTFTTDYNGNADRMKNIENATAFIDGTVLMPGEVFDTYHTIGPFTLDNGYFYATQYVGGKTVPGIGGGICQVSTTLYNAVLLSELDVLERKNHGMTVAYVKLSMDAAISGDYMNFKFQNSTDYPIYIQGICENGKVTFTIYGNETRPANRTIEFESVTISTMAPGEPVEEIDETMAPGTRKVTQNAKNGYVAELWKHIYIDGVLQESVKVNTSTYRATPQYVSVGPPAEETPGTEAPQPTDPGTEAPQPTDPGTEAPQPTDPGTEPQPTDPNTEAPQPTDPGTGASQPEVPSTQAPQPTADPAAETTPAQ